MKKTPNPKSEDSNRLFWGFLKQIYFIQSGFKIVALIILTGYFNFMIIYMLNKIFAVLIILILCPVFSCKPKEEKNQVPIDQINIDKSTDYKYIFKDAIEKEKQKEKKNSTDPFKE